MSLLRTRWAAVGAAVAITLGAGGVSLTQAAITSGEKPVYVSLDAPCRVLDTRGGPKIGAAASLDVQITGTNGDCTGGLAIPTDAVGVATNVTVIQPDGAPSGRSFFTVYPTGATRPTTSNLNFVNGQAPTPNKVDVGIGTGGKITIYNNEGTAHAAVDIFGYYIDHNHDDRYYTETEVDTKLGAKANTTDVTAALATKANISDVYTKTEIDASTANALRAGGVVLATGEPRPGFADVGDVTTARTNTGSYTIEIPGANPGCAGALPIPILSPQASTNLVGWSFVATECGSGTVTIGVTVRSTAGTLVDGAFQFLVIGQPVDPLASLSAAALPADAVCTLDMTTGQESCT